MRALHFHQPDDLLATRSLPSMIFTVAGLIGNQMPTNQYHVTDNNATLLTSKASVMKITAPVWVGVGRLFF